jgi:hypothetical protein
MLTAEMLFRVALALLALPLALVVAWGAIQAFRLFTRFR